MPRVVFSTENQLKTWAEREVTIGRYKIYVTERGEIIFHPTKSTRNLEYAYYNAGSKEDALRIAKTIQQKKEIPIYEAKSYEWKIDTPPEVHVPAIPETINMKIKRGVTEISEEE